MNPQASLYCSPQPLAAKNNQLQHRIGVIIDNKNIFYKVDYLADKLKKLIQKSKQP